MMSCDCASWNDVLSFGVNGNITHATYMKYWFLSCDAMMSQINIPNVNKVVGCCFKWNKTGQYCWY